MGKLNNDEAFRHINYHATDLRRTFARVRRELKAEAEAKESAASAQQSADDAIREEISRKLVALPRKTA